MEIQHEGDAWAIVFARVVLDRWTIILVMVPESRVVLFASLAAIVAAFVQSLRGRSVRRGSANPPSTGRL